MLGTIRYPPLFRIHKAFPPTSTLTKLRLPLQNHRSNSNMATQTVEIAASEIKDGEMKEINFGGKEQAVLVSRLGDKVFATSAYCTHYGAPLAKGVLTNDGRVTCPWHSACFNVKTGDIEDGPGRDSLHCFRAVLSPDNEKITITAPVEKTKKANKTRLPFLPSNYAEAAPAGTKGVVVVGGGAGALSVMESLREYGYNGPVTVLSKEGYAPIDRTKLSKSLMTDLSQLEWRPASALKDTFGIDLRTSTVVTAVDTVSKTVTLESGGTVGYDTLVLAPGSIPRKLPIEGADLENVFTLRSVDDTKKMQGLKSDGKNIVVIGTSFIGMELVAVVMNQKFASINVIGMEEVPFERVLGKEIGFSFMKFFESKGVRFHMKAKISKLTGKSTISSTLTSAAPSVATVELESGLSLPADFVVMGVGVRPATDFIKENPAFKAAFQDDGGLKVDEYLKVQGVEDVYAVGDIAHYQQTPGHQSRRTEHWNVATDHGRAVGSTIAGKPKAYDRVPIFWSALGQQLRYCGTGAGYEDVIIKGDPNEMKFIAYYTKGDSVLAVSSMQNDPVVSKCSELIRLELMPSATELKEGKDPMSIDISSVSSGTKKL